MPTSMVSSIELKRVIVIGAGWSGLAAAKTYLELNPEIELTILEAEKSIGGVWCAERLYPGFMTDSPSGLFDYSDLPMRDALGVKDWEDVPAFKIHEYLKVYAEIFSLRERVRLDTKVSEVTRNRDSIRWDVSVDGSDEILTCDKLIVATGTTSLPKWPDVPRHDFVGLVMHSKDVGQYYQDLTSSKINRVTVYGGCKSAIDVINLCILGGKNVDWVIRDTGNGPGMMVELKSCGVQGARFLGRWKGAFLPSIFRTDGFRYRFLQSGASSLGTWFCSKMWSLASKAPLAMGPYKTKCENMEKLMPETKDSLFFTASLSALHGKLNKKFVKQLHTGELIQVHRASITSMSGDTVLLSNGTSLQSDAAVFCTGWETTYKIFDQTTAHELGISAPLQSQSDELKNYWDELGQKADADVLETLPRLKYPPPYNKKKIANTPVRLYRYILPPILAGKDDHSLIFLGEVVNIMTSIVSEVSALWGVAWMEGLLEKMHTIPQKPEMDYEIARFNAWCSRRYLSRGDTKPLIAAESQDIIDLWMKDLGLQVHRRSLLPDVFLSYRSQDYQGIVQELLAKTKFQVGK